jgi:hypothetical protein
VIEGGSALRDVANVQDGVIATAEHWQHQLVVAGGISKRCSQIGAHAGVSVSSLQAMGV